MQVGIVTLFPELFGPFLSEGLLGRAIAAGHVRVQLVNPRDFATDRHRTVDDAPYGGGSGMVMMPGPLLAAVDALEGGGPRRHRILLTPQGSPLRQRDAARLARLEAFTLVCGRYEGVDERVRARMDEELSLGDFVLFGGEVAAMAVVEAAGRLVPGVLGNEASVEEESHAAGLLEYPQYTRPATFESEIVPDVLLSGDHAAVARYRRRESLRRTWLRRPDLLVEAPLTDEDRRVLAEIRAEDDER